ncbi:hypothetical protein HB943_03440 [Listeria weihenstephanensis]|uniref:DUF5082 domain-containing protein n=1 Tax=Listeria weihenstephanensis TaxID=1006155 RepID=A0A841Z2W2_9LIST|nr:hypothetical protein [Listeria weihenstephanensis]MBC1499644.1 hypothetical protein [Listeria weihenstephanensis]
MDIISLVNESTKEGGRMSKYDTEIASVQQSITGQQEKIRRLEELVTKVQRQGEHVGNLPTRQLDLPQDLWQDTSDSVIRQVLQRRLQFWNNQSSVVKDLVREIRTEINRAQNQVSDFQADARYYTNLKQLEEEANV